MLGKQEDRSTLDGRDSLNLAEYPISTLTDRPDAALRTLEFQDIIHDRGTGKQVQRKLRIVASQQYGLPTPLDVDVLIGLITLTKHRSDFQERSLQFTRYELMRTLRWKDNGENYVRLELAMNRWVTVTYQFENAWRDKALEQWLSKESIHMVERYAAVDPAEYSIATRSTSLREMVWGETIFDSFQAEYIKKLNLDVYFSLQTPIAKRLYRFLDKRLYRAPVQQFELLPFAFEKIGMSRLYKVGKIKQLLDRSIEDLVRVGFLAPTTKRYFKKGDERWWVGFALPGAVPAIEKAKPQPTAAPRKGLDPVEAYWETLTAEDQKAVERAALEAASEEELDGLNIVPPMMRKAYLASIRRTYIEGLLTQSQRDK